MNSYREQWTVRSQGIADAIADRAYAPHCDQLVLHSPGTCWACDGYPDWQQAREAWGVNFTGGTDPERLPCPAELRRPVELINRWHGNVAETADEAEAGWTAWVREFDAALCEECTPRKTWLQTVRTWFGKAAE